MEFEPEIRAALAGQVDSELATRSLSGALVYFLVAVAVGLSSNYGREHPTVLYTTILLSLAAGVVRILAAQSLLKSSPKARPVFRLATYTTFVIWGAFGAWSVHLYAGGWTAMFVLLCCTALASGATSSLAPDIALAWRCLLLLCVPTIIAIVSIGDRRHWGLAFVTCIYLAFLIAQTKRNWRWFWSATVAAERERIRGSAERLRAEEERATLMIAIEQADEEILITDIEGKIQYCNRAFERITGYSRHEALGNNPRFLRSGKHPPEFYRSLWDTVRAGNVWTGRLTNRTKQGNLYEADGSISPILDASGKLTGFVAARRDVTERLRLESELRQAQKMESIGRLAGGVAHDFNNLLTVIMGFSSVLEEQLSGGRLSGYAEGIHTAANRAANLTQQLLAFSRKQVIAPRPLDLNLLIADFKKILQRLVADDVELETILAPSLGSILADPGQMNQILMNLAANARDAMPNGGKLIIRTANVGEGECDRVMLSVSDDGEGFDEATRSRIFEPFFTTKEHGSGTGLGLSTVYGIVRQSNGSIEVQSEPGRGTTFNISFPQVRVDQPLAAALERPAPEREGSGSGMVLVIEDQDDVRRVVTEALEAHGYDVIEASGGHDAIEIAGEFDGPIDLLITDVMMPEMTGPVAAAQLQSLRPEMKTLFISGYSNMNILDPAAAYLAKPFSSVALIQRVRQVLAG